APPGTPVPVHAPQPLVLRAQQGGHVFRLEQERPREAGDRLLQLGQAQLERADARLELSPQVVTIDFQHGNASRMPYADESFDLVVCQAAFKNFTDPLGALDETYR